ncbi:hypothetical protein Pmani_026817 [Petrolisthes manimaculis]|uniref:Phospholipid-transporting ATPase n=1 Tax=Petrolisthes manimaculis TaxID=1843537 RepID=A0AAE1P5D0_9EUCA|nr:hypothetical protein Pmani_026817 [Petrolisthes manimaculis]
MPHANLYDFKGRLEVYGGDATTTHAPLSTDNLLLRGARLKNTSLIHGMAIYTGRDTKVALNSKIKSNKFSTVDMTMNYFLVFYLVLMVGEIILCTALKYGIFTQEVTNNMWYLDYPTDDPITARLVYQDAVSFLVIFSYIIPVSLYVTLEIQKFLGTMFLQWDEEVTGTGEDEAPKVNTSDLNEELGQVEYLFSDKTGTLTENVMNFRQCSVNSRRYKEMDEENGVLVFLHPDTLEPQPLPRLLPDDLVTFLETLALCHTVQVSSSSHKPGEDRGGSSEVTAGQMEMEDLTPVYHASSPDEKALVEACARYGVVFRGSREKMVTLEVLGHTKTFTSLEVLEFDSDRKCMSVVVREEATGKVWLLTKGAESSVLQRCGAGDSDHQHLINTTADHIDDYAMTGLRTLAVGRRQLEEKQYLGFTEQLSKARQMVEGREAAVRKVTDRMEADLTLLGATGVEDLLQEGVQETLESFRAAGIKVWVLTGDKVETAVNIAYSCGHFKRFMTILTLTGLTNTEDAHEMVTACMEKSSSEDKMYGLVVDGSSLVLLLDHNIKDDFYRLCTRCWAVVCCRMSPSQKAETVRLVKNSKESPRCAAVGDGANDVSMIQEAHLGLGIMGKEGRQAVRCADFGVAQFRFLRKLLFVHGHWNYVRLATFVQFSFYKNVAFNTPMVFFTIWNAYSTQSVYEGLVLTMFNVTCTSLPVLLFGLVEQNLPASLLMTRPHLYQRVAHNAVLSWTRFFKWTLFGLWHSVVMYFGLMGACWDDTCGLPRGQTPDLYLFGLALATLCIFVVNIKIMMESNYLTWVFVGGLAITFLGYSVMYLLYTGIPTLPFITYEIYWAYYRIFESPSLNLTFLVLGVTCLLPDLLDKIYTHTTDKELRRGRDGKAGIGSFRCQQSSVSDTDSLSQQERKPGLLVSDL